MIQADVLPPALQIPGPIGIVMVVGALCGAVGAFAGDLATDAGKLERAKSDDTGWSLGFIGKMLVGAIAAAVVLTLNPPGESWLALVGTALAAGIGGDAVVVSFVATGRVDAAERRTSDVASVAIQQMDEVAHAVQASPSQGTGVGIGGPAALQFVVPEKLNTAKAALRSFLKR